MKNLVHNPIKVVHCKRNPFDVYIGRPSIWGNPFRSGVDGTRKEVIEQYRLYVLSNLELMSRLMELDGKILGCWCSPKLCHGDALCSLIEDMKNEKRVMEEFYDL
jgi:hypothetical protein